jgi:hypothetical protein
MDELKKKLLIKEGKSHLVVNALNDYNTMLNDLIPDFEISAGEAFDWLLLFVKNKEQLQEHYIKIKPFISSDTIFWIAYPKKSGKIRTDLSRDKGWDVIYANGFRTVSLISLDENWSVMRFREGEMPDLSAKPAEERAKLVLPQELKEAFAADNKLAIFFNSLAYTHRKEYISWIEEAKKEETRAARIAKTIELLKNKQKLR